MRTAHATAPFSMSQAGAITGLPSSYIKALISEDLLAPSRDMRFTFQDLVLLRAARRLLASGVPSYKVVAALAHVRESLAADYRKSLN
ncbi:MerR family transcriptional regulator [Mitsuaria sp. 7]|uniref:MerR family transcriptional regulator n=1 Tax=Mitsuaria sp. 7 TaxID=1658665 RepID=UPI0007DDBDA3|nr:MerR family transcriptional regulator [Mitsuaria sp. 7]ANH67424.1 hypothetical protein ABE85_07280 [Mitsuaria sp. 7]